MEKVVSTERVPIKMWLNDIEDGALEQAKNLANLPFTFKHVALMPDSHQGYGMPIGGVLATKGVVIPNAVGVDVGCGMVAKKLNLSVDRISHNKINEIVDVIKQKVPVGFNHHNKKQNDWLTKDEFNGLNDDMIVKQQYEKSLYQLGTLGGGNHFIEVQKDATDDLWIMIHSGSRNLGKKVADHYNKIAKDLNDKFHSVVESNKNLAFLPMGRYFDEYMAEMNLCVKFAFENRKHMMNNVIDAFEEVLGTSIVDNRNLINIAHNYAAFENHYNTNVIVHRKGATSARLGEIGIIPGSQGTKSYIVKGLGNKESFNSCSHGAGRIMGRKQAQRTLNLDEEIKKLDELGVIHSIKSEKDLDEAAGAYKNIDIVMENQGDLVTILHELSPVAVVKG